MSTPGVAIHRRHMLVERTYETHALREAVLSSMEPPGAGATGVCGLKLLVYEALSY